MDAAVDPGEGMGMLIVPTIRTEAPKDTGVPAIVVPGPPGVRVMPPIATPPDGSVVIFWPAIVARTGAVEGAILMGIVLLPTTSPDGPSETGVPNIVIAEAPGAKGVPSTSMPDDPAVTLSPPTTTMGEVSFDGS